MAEKILGVIGGSGLYEMDGLDVTKKVTIKTPYGYPSDQIIFGNLRGKKMAFLPRHGVGHFIPPSEINFRANIFAMKKIGVEKISILVFFLPIWPFEHGKFRPNPGNRE